MPTPIALPALTKRETQIMEILHRRGEATARDVWSDLSDSAGYSGIRKLLEILTAKKHVVRDRDGKRYVYRPSVSTATASKMELKRVLRSFFHGNVESAMVALLSLSRSETDEADLDRLLVTARDAARRRKHK